MKNKFLYIALYAAGILGATSCSDYLETKSPSTVDADFVFSSTATAKAALEGAKAAMHGAYSSHIFGDGLYYAADIAGQTSCAIRKDMPNSLAAIRQKHSIATEPRLVLTDSPRI